MSPFLFFIIVAIVTALIVYCLLVYSLEEESGKSFIWAIIISILFFVGTDYTAYEKYKEREYKSSIVLVSTSPSETEQQGKFGLFFGVINHKRFYLVRQEVSKGYYMDHGVTGKVYLREDDTLKDKGYLKQDFSCTIARETYKFFGAFYERVYHEVCNATYQEITVPVGSVVKELRL